MIKRKSWQEFEKEIIALNKKFYVYGAGMVYEKIIHFASDLIYGILDVNAPNIKNKYSDIPIIEPTKIFTENAESFSILSCLNPFRDYEERSDEISLFFSNCEKNIIFYYLDYKKINETGILNWNGKELLINNLLFLVNEGWKRDFIKLAYSDVVGFGYSYMKKLYDEPIDYVLFGDRLGLKDFSNGLIMHKNGRKEVTGYRKIQRSSNIWLFGDSRVSGMLNANDTTFANYLQNKIIYNDTICYRVLNCGIPGRDIERMFYQVQKEDIHQGDIVILSTGFYEYEGDLLKNVFLWFHYIKMIYEECKNKQAKFIYINLPTILEMQNRTELENEMLEFFNTTEFTEYDIKEMIFCKNIISLLCGQSGIIFYDFSDAFRDRKKYGHVFINLHHYGPHGNRLIADKIYELLLIMEKCNEIKDKDIEKEWTKKDKDLRQRIKNMKNKERELESYIDNVREKLDIKSLKDKHIGSIVMNANPFTYGHLFLVKEALKNVDFLIVFVVSEDASFFSFCERFEMVNNNLKNNKVLVVPSGKFCISKYTFPDYFKKEDLQGKKTNAQTDLQIFAKKIAPALGITTRFIGEEPEDTITNQYNIEMKKILPDNGIRVMEIPRKRLSDGTVISASRVRKYFIDLELDEIETLVPEPTRKLLNKYITTRTVSGKGRK